MKTLTESVLIFQLCSPLMQTLKIIILHTKLYLNCRSIVPTSSPAVRLFLFSPLLAYKRYTHMTVMINRLLCTMLIVFIISDAIEHFTLACVKFGLLRQRSNTTTKAKQARLVVSSV